MHSMWPWMKQRVGCECLKARSKPWIVRGWRDQVDVVSAPRPGIEARASCSSKDSRCVQLAYDHRVQACTKANKLSASFYILTCTLRSETWGAGSNIFKKGLKNSVEALTWFTTRGRKLPPEVRVRNGSGTVPTD